jgi:hypothetical protein
MNQQSKETFLNQQTDNRQSIFEPSEVINIDYWLLHHNELTRLQEINMILTAPETRPKI